MSKFVIIDMVKGFCENGALADPKIKEDLLEPIHDVCRKQPKEDLVFICDHHFTFDPELDTFPEHCIAFTEEAEIIDELKEFETETNRFNKNSTNGMLIPAVQNLLDTDEDVYIMGCCTDICVLSFAITLKTFKNTNYRKGDVIVYENCVSTYDAPNHNAKEYHKKAIDLMRVQGIIVKNS